MDAILTSVPGIHTSSSLAHAAQRLAEAVATLADVAQAVSTAANTFSLEVLAHEASSALPATIPTGSAPIVLYESDSESSTTNEELGNISDAGVVGKRASSVHSEDTEYTNPEDPDYYQLDSTTDDQASVPQSNGQATSDRIAGVDQAFCSSEPIPLDRMRFDPTQPPAVSVGTFDEVVVERNQGYHILVDNEADVLLFLCALLHAREGLKAICYMNCSLPAFNMYKKLINNVTGSPTYAVTKTAPVELESVGTAFIEEKNGVLLLPETVCPDIKLGNTDSWVIHIGWPVDEQKFDEQRKTHEARHNILLGYSADEDLYPAGYEAMWQSMPWPGDVDSFRLSVGALRPLFNSQLDMIPVQMKEKIYPDWIASHGARGRRYVRSWTPSDLVYRANTYLLGALRYPSELPHPDSADANLPEVSAGFVAHNGLESAVKEGLLHVKSSPGINHISSHSKAHFIAPDTSQLTSAHRTSSPSPPNYFQEGIPDVSQWAPSNDRFIPTFAEPLSSANPNTAGISWNESWSLPSGSRQDPKTEVKSREVPYQVSPAFRPRFAFGSLDSADATLEDTSGFGFITPGQDRANITSTARAFQPTPGLTHFILQEEFDAIPLICFLATTTEAKKTIVFIDDAGSASSYKLLLREITGHLVIAPDLMQYDQSREDAALQFLVYRGATILLLSYNCKKLPTQLHNASVDYCIYWGEGNFVPLLQAKKHRTQLNCLSTSVIMTIDQKVKLGKSLRDIQEHPSSTDLLNPDRSPWLTSTRNITKSCLEPNEEVARGLYEARLRCLAGLPRDVRSAEEVAYEANRYAARVLLRGDPDDGSQVFPPVGGMIAIPAGMVRALKLQSAATAGLLAVIA